MSASQRNKGKGWEQAVARAFREVMPGQDIKRGWQARQGADAPDVYVPCHWVECKASIQTNPRAALEQAVEASKGKGVWPIAVCKDDRKPPFVCMRLEDYLDLIGEWWAGRHGVYR